MSTPFLPAQEEPVDPSVPPPPPSLDPAPPLPYAPSASSSSSILRGWPGNHRGPLLILFDPFSSKASSVRAEVEDNLFSSGRTLPTTLLAFEATHLILDPDCPQSSWVRQAARPDQHVVRFEWIEDSLLHGFSVPESGYGLDSTNFGGAAAASSFGNGGSGEVEEERDELGRGGREQEEQRSDSGTDYSSSEDEAFEGVEEAESMEQLPKPRPKERVCHNCKTTSSSDWRFLKEKGGALTCGSCRGIFYKANGRKSGSGDAALAARARQEGVEVSEEEEEEEEQSSLSESDASSIEEQSPPQPSTSTNKLASRPVRRSRRSARTPYTPQEKEDLVRILAGRNTSVLEVARKLREIHPSRSVRGISRYYSRNRAWYDAAVRSFKRKALKEHRVEPGLGSSSNSDSNIDEEPQQPPSFSSSSNHHQQQQPGASSSRLPVFQGPRPNATRPQQPSPFPVASSSISNHHQHPPFSSNFYPIPHPSTTSSRSQLQANSSLSTLEPDSFRLPGVAPSFLPPSSPFCFFCGDISTYRWKMLFDLVAWKERADGAKTFHRVGSKRACQPCSSFVYNRRIGRVQPPEGLEGMLREAWITEEVLKKGMRVRREGVEGGGR